MDDQFFAFLGGILLCGAIVLGVTVFFVPEAIFLDSIGECAADYDSALREATGIAEIEVDFRDGDAVAVRCASADVKLIVR